MNRLVKTLIRQSSKLNKIKSKTKYSTNATSVSDKSAFPGYKGDFSTTLEFIYPENNPQIQCYRVMNRKGVVLDPSHDPQVILEF
jgi:hypothetical protein